MNVVGDVSAFILGGGFVAYLTQYLFDRYLGMQLEKHKNSLSLEIVTFKHQFLLEVEKYKEKLNESALEHQVKFTQLHEERAQIIKELYRRILLLSDDLRDQTIALVSGNGNGNYDNNGNNTNNGVLIIDIVTDELIDFYNYFLEKKLYFSIELTSLIEQLFEKYLGQIQFSLNLRSYLRKCKPDNQMMSCDLEKISVDINQTIEVMSRLEERIVQEFQELLGVG